jgi:transcriptional regulator with XRE-family HTH domain
VSAQGSGDRAGGPSSSEPAHGRALVAVNLRRLRTGRSLSQEALADRAGIHRTYLSSVERAERNVSIDNICRLARALDVDVRELLAPARLPAREYGSATRRRPVLKVSEPSKAPPGRRR